jgi:hypothetical protein
LGSNGGQSNNWPGTFVAAIGSDDQEGTMVVGRDFGVPATAECGGTTADGALQRLLSIQAAFPPRRQIGRTTAPAGCAADPPTPAVHPSRKDRSPWA